MWKNTTLGEYYDVRDGTHDSPKYVENGYPLVTSKNLKNGEIDLGNVKFISENDYQQINKRSEVELGDVLMGMIGTIGNPVVISKPPAFAIKNVALFKLHEGQSSRFLRYFLMHPNTVKTMLTDAKGTTQKFVGLNYLRNFPISIPPLTEQQRIVAKLDAAFAEIDEIAKNTKKLMDSAKAIFENSVKQYFSTDNAQCELKKLSEMTTYFNGLTYSPKDVGETGTVVLRSSNIQNGRMDFSDIVRVNKTIKEKLFVQPTDILICSRNGSKALIGKCSVVGEQCEPMTFGTFMMIVRGENNNYLQWFFKSKLFKEQIAQGENTAINQITRYMLDDVVLPVPDTPTQVVISNKLEAIDKHVRRLELIYQNKINELNSLKSAILLQELQSEAA